jgi:hypothetical protein
MHSLCRRQRLLAQCPVLPLALARDIGASTTAAATAGAAAAIGVPGVVRAEDPEI